MRPRRTVRRWKAPAVILSVFPVILLHPLERKHIRQFERFELKFSNSQRDKKIFKKKKKKENDKNQPTLDDVG